MTDRQLVATERLSGAFVTVDNRIHALFVMRRDSEPRPMVRPRPSERASTDRDAPAA